METFTNHCLQDQVEQRRTGIKKVLELERKLAAQATDQVANESVRIKAVVMELRNEHNMHEGYYSSGGYELSPSCPKPKPGSLPIDRLRHEGLKAVPELIDALDSDTLTRSVSYCSRYAGGFLINNLGLLAWSALVEIAQTTLQ